eukprot:scaffold293712_cov32-Tisochrysis_lutea.AAC.5
MLEAVPFRTEETPRLKPGGPVGVGVCVWARCCEVRYPHVPPSSGPEEDWRYNCTCLGWKELTRK